MINVLLFAHLREVVGEEELVIATEEMTVADVKAWLEARYSLELKQVMSAVNEAFAMEHTVVKTGDTIAFIPPISGG